MRRAPSHAAPLRHTLRSPLGLVLVLAASGCGSGGPSDDDRATPVAMATIEGVVTLGPQCPVVQVDTPCPDTPATGVDVTVSQDAGGGTAAGDLVARAVTDTFGHFDVSVPPGSYLVTAVAGMSCALAPVRPEVAGTTVEVALTCDTGIR